VGIWKRKRKRKEKESKNENENEKKRNIKTVVTSPPPQDSRPENRTSSFHLSAVCFSIPPIVGSYCEDNPYRTFHLPTQRVSLAPPDPYGYDIVGRIWWA